MRRAITNDGMSWLLTAVMVIVLIPMIFIFLIIKAVFLPIDRPMRRSPDEVARYLRDFLNGTGGPCDWDDFTSIPVADPRLDDLRERASMLDPRVEADGGSALLVTLIGEAEMITDDDSGLA